MTVDNNVSSAENEYQTMISWNSSVKCIPDETLLLQHFQLRKEMYSIRVRCNQPKMFFLNIPIKRKSHLIIFFVTDNNWVTRCWILAWYSTQPPCLVVCPLSLFFWRGTSILPMSQALFKLFKDLYKYFYYYIRKFGLALLRWAVWSV